MISVQPAGSGELYMKAIVYSTFGVGKTLFAAGAARHAKMGPVLVVNLEQGAITASHIEGVFETDLIHQTGDMHEVFWNIANGTKNDACDWSVFKTVIIDSGTALQDLNILEIAADNANARKTATRISQQDWGDSTRAVQAILQNFRSLPMHVFVTAGLRDIYRADTDAAKKATTAPVGSGPDFTPKLARKLNHIFDHVWALSMNDEGTRYLLTQTDGIRAAKTRGEVFAAEIGDVIESPDVPELFDIFTRTQQHDRQKSVRKTSTK